MNNAQKTRKLSSAASHACVLHIIRLQWGAMPCIGLRWLGAAGLRRGRHAFHGAHSHGWGPCMAWDSLTHHPWARTEKSNTSRQCACPSNTSRAASSRLASPAVMDSLGGGGCPPQTRHPALISSPVVRHIPRTARCHGRHTDTVSVLACALAWKYD